MVSLVQKWKGVFFGVLFYFVCGYSTAQAGVISIQTDLTVNQTETRTSVEVGVRNLGDEAAYNIRVTVEVGDVVRRSVLHDELQVDEQIKEVMDFEIHFEKPGMYPVLTSVDYTDSNRYPFTAISVGELNVQEKVLGRVSGELKLKPFAKKGEVQVIIKNLEKEEKEFYIHLFIPKEFSSSRDNMAVTVASGREETVEFELENISALGGSQYQIFAVVTFTDETYHYTHTLTSTVLVIASKSFVGAYFEILLAVAFILIVVVVSLNFRIRRRQFHLP